MKKLLAIILTAALLMGVCGFSAFAAEDDQPSPTVGPWDGVSWMNGGPMISISSGTDEHLIYYRQGTTAESPVITDNEALPGATYDKASNTLTLDNVRLPDDKLRLYYMGDDFKLCVKGECELSFIGLYNYLGYYSTSLSITGTGTLTVNKEKLEPWAIYFFGDGKSLMHLDIAPSVTVHMYAQESANETTPNVVRIWSTYADPAITVDSKSIPEAKSAVKTETINESVDAAWVNDTDKVYPHGKRVTSKTDPDGIYAVKEIQYSEGNGFETRYGITKYNYYSEFNMYLPDPDYVNQYGDENIILTKAEFEAGYDYVTAPQPKPIRFTSDYREETRGYRGVRFAKDGEPDGVYIGEKGWSTAYGSELGEVSTYYLYKARWDEDEQLYVVDEHYPAIARGSADELAANGYTIVTEDVEKPVTMKCWVEDAPYDDNNRQGTYELVTRKSDPDGLYAYMGKYTDGPQPNESGVIISPIVYDAEYDEYYLRGYYGGLVGQDVFHVTDEDWASENCDFAYKTETVTQRVELQFITKNYDYEYYSTEAILLTKDGATCAAELLKWSDGRREYEVYQVEWREDKGRYYATDNGDWEHRYENLEALEAAGYHVVYEEQPVDYTTTGSVTLSKQRALYQDESGNKYFMSWDGSKSTPNTFSESNKFVYGDTEYYIGTVAEGVNAGDLNQITHEQLLDDSMWWIEGTEYHHIGSETAGVLIGDANGDGEVNITDVTTIQCHVAEVMILTGDALIAADTNGDGVIDINDATHLQKYIAEYDVVLGKQA